MSDRTHLSLNAFNIRSTSTSRWKADASRLSSLSISSADAVDADAACAGVEIAVELGVDDFEEEEGSVDMVVVVEACSHLTHQCISAYCLLTLLTR